MIYELLPNRIINNDIKVNFLYKTHFLKTHLYDKLVSNDKYR